MQSHETVQIRVGLFVFLAVFLAMIVIFLLGNEKQLFKRQYTVVASFENISGLRVGAQVQLAGVGVGMVERIAFSPEPGEKKVEVRLSLNKEYQERIRRDSVAAVVTQGLLGDKIISISIGTPDQEILKDGDLIQAEERPSLFAVAEKGGEIMKNIDSAAKTLTRVLQEVEKRPIVDDVTQMASDLRVAAKELRLILEKVRKGEGTIGALLTDPSLYHDLRQLFQKVERNKILTHIIRSRVRDLESEKK